MLLLNMDYIIPFIRGLFDTDGSVSLKKRHTDYHYYPTITIRQKSRDIIKQIESVLKRMNFQFMLIIMIIEMMGRGISIMDVNWNLMVKEVSEDG